MFDRDKLTTVKFEGEVFGGCLCCDYAKVEKELKNLLKNRRRKEIVEKGKRIQNGTNDLCISFIILV